MEAQSNIVMTEVLSTIFYHIIISLPSRIMERVSQSVLQMIDYDNLKRQMVYYDNLKEAVITMYEKTNQRCLTS